MKGIIWLASYPKSGNTWLRTFITNLLAQSNQPIHINQLQTHGIASSRNIFDDSTGLEASDLTPEEIDWLRPEVYSELASQAEKTLYIKVHDAYTLLPGDRPLIPSRGSKGAVYIIRNPLDTAVSLSFHLNCDLDTAIKHMGNVEYCFAGKANRLNEQLRQKLLTWSGHVESWVDMQAFPLRVVRYEDMHLKPLATFSDIANFMGMNSEKAQIQTAIEYSSFAKLKGQEEQSGFREKPPKMEAFFREGKIGGWRDMLTPIQVAKVLDDHGAVMRRFGYLQENGEITY